MKTKVFLTGKTGRFRGVRQLSLVYGRGTEIVDSGLLTPARKFLKAKREPHER